MKYNVQLICNCLCKTWSIQTGWAGLSKHAFIKQGFA